MIVALSGCDYINNVDNKPMSAKINGVQYKSEGYALSVMAPCEMHGDDSTRFTISLTRILRSAEHAVELHICFTTYDSLEPEAGVVYPINSKARNPYLWDSCCEDFPYDAYESGWITFSRIEGDEYGYTLEGNFEITFFGFEGEPYVITEGTFGPLSCIRFHYL